MKKKKRKNLFHCRPISVFVKGSLLRMKKKKRKNLFHHHPIGWPLLARILSSLSFQELILVVSLWSPPNCWISSEPNQILLDLGNQNFQSELGSELVFKGRKKTLKWQWMPFGNFFSPSATPMISLGNLKGVHIAVVPLLCWKDQIWIALKKQSLSTDFPAQLKMWRIFKRTNLQKKKPSWKCVHHPVVMGSSNVVHMVVLHVIHPYGPLLLNWVFGFAVCFLKLDLKSGFWKVVFKISKPFENWKSVDIENQFSGLGLPFFLVAQQNWLNFYCFFFDFVIGTETEKETFCCQSSVVSFLQTFLYSIEKDLQSHAKKTLATGGVSLGALGKSVCEQIWILFCVDNKTNIQLIQFI